MKELEENSGKTAKEKGMYDMLLIVNEMMARGFEFLPVDIRRSHATKFLVEDGKLRIPFVSVSGVGENVSQNIYDAMQSGNIGSIEELQSVNGIGRSVTDKLESIGAMGDLPKSDQMSFF